MSRRKAEKAYEESLKEILSAGPDKVIRHTAAANDQEHESPPPIVHQEQQKDKFIELIVRIIAGLAVIGMLLLFGNQIAGR